MKVRFWLHQRHDYYQGWRLIGDVINKAIDILPVELYLPGYQYYGFETNLNKRFKWGDPGINKLDAVCKTHDWPIVYNEYSDTARHNIADNKLIERTWERVKAYNSD